MKRAIAVLLLLAVGGAATAWGLGLADRLPPVLRDLPAVAARHLPWTAAEAPAGVFYGNVDIREVALGFRVAGRVAEVLVDEGDRVAAGDVLARLDTRPFSDQLAAAKARLAAQDATLAKLEAGARPDEIAKARATVDERLADLRYADLAYERAVQLRPSGSTTDAAVDRARSTRDMAAARVETARGDLRLLEAGTRVEDVAAARAGRAEAEAGVASAETSLADAILLAPADGVIVTRVHEQGSIVPVGETVLVLSLEKPVYVRAYAAETELGLVRPGSVVEILSDTRPDRPLTGRVGFVSPVAEFTPKSVETADLRTALVYRFRVTVDDSEGLLRQGMPVTVRLRDGIPVAGAAP